MKRQDSFVRDVEAEGTQESANEAIALGIVAQPEFVRNILLLKTMMDQFGGEVYIGAYRDKYDLNGDRIPKAEQEDTPGEWHTSGYLFHFESVASNTHRATGAPEKQKDDRLNKPRPLEAVEEEPAPDIKAADREALAAIEEGAAA